MTINKNSVEQINVALLDMDKKIKSAVSNGTSASDFKNLEASVDNIKRTLDEAKAGLEPGKTYDINISGNAATADKATTATTAEIATTATTAETATTATTATTADKATTATTAETATTATTAETATTANKVSNALTVNGKTYNGSEAVDAGVQTVANGGTGVTTQADINKAFIGNLDIGESDVTDGTEFVSSYASDNGFAETADGALNKPYKRQFVKVWNYIKGKISSVLGLTANNYGGKASTAGTADITNALSGRGGITNTDTFQNVMNNNGKWNITDLNLKTSDYTYGYETYTVGTNYYGGSNSNVEVVFTPQYTITDGSYSTRAITSPVIQANNKMVIPIGEPSSLEDGCIWIEADR